MNKEEQKEIKNDILTCFSKALDNFDPEYLLGTVVRAIEYMQRNDPRLSFSFKPQSIAQQRVITMFNTRTSVEVLQSTVDVQLNFLSELESNRKIIEQQNNFLEEKQNIILENEKTLNKTLDLLKVETEEVFSLNRKLDEIKNFDEVSCSICGHHCS